MTVGSARLRRVEVLRLGVLDLKRILEVAGDSGFAWPVLLHPR